MVTIDGESTMVFVDDNPFFSGGSDVPITADEGLSYAEFNYTGEVTDEQIFGGWQAPAPQKIYGVQVVAETPPQGSNLSGILVDESDAEIAGTEFTLTAGEGFEATTFVTAHTVITGDIIKAKIKNVGATTAGGYLNVRLVIGPVS